MHLALDEAKLAAAANEVPVGAVLTKGETVIARAHNYVRRNADPTAHAEMLVLRAGAAALGSERLLNCVLYVTLEPCAMCYTAAMHARVARIIYGAPAIRHGLVAPQMIGGIAEDACRDVLQQFFAQKRIP